MNILEQMLQDSSKHNIPLELLQALYGDQMVETERDDDQLLETSAKESEDSDEV